MRKLLRGSLTFKTVAIEKQQAEFNIKTLRRVFLVSRSSWYAWRLLR